MNVHIRTSMFWGLMSKWRILLWCKYVIAERTSREMRTLSSIFRGFPSWDGKRKRHTRHFIVFTSHKFFLYLSKIDICPKPHFDLNQKNLSCIVSKTFQSRKLSAKQNCFIKITSFLNLLRRWCRRDFSHRWTAWLQVLHSSYVQQPSTVQYSDASLSYQSNIKRSQPCSLILICILCEIYS